MAAKKEKTFQKNEKHPKKSDSQKEVESLRKRFEKLHQGLSEVDFKTHVYPEGSTVEVDSQVFVDIINALSGAKMFLMKMQEAQTNLINAVANNAEFLDGTILPVMEKHLSNILSGKTNKVEMAPEVDHNLTDPEKEILVNDSEEAVSELETQGTDGEQ